MKSYQTQTSPKTGMEHKELSKKADELVMKSVIAPTERDFDLVHAAMGIGYNLALDHVMNLGEQICGPARV